MPTVVSYSSRDLLASKIVPPGWYRVMVDDISSEPSADGKSMNYPVEGTIICNADDGTTDFAGVPLGIGKSWMFNSKVISFSIDFLRSFGVEINADTRYDLDASKGKILDVFVENDTYQGRLKNKVNHKYRPAKGM